MSEAIEALWETNPEAAKHFVRQLERENAALREALQDLLDVYEKVRDMCGVTRDSYTTNKARKALGEK